MLEDACAAASPAGGAAALRRLEADRIPVVSCAGPEVASLPAAAAELPVDLPIPRPEYDDTYEAALLRQEAAAKAAAARAAERTRTATAGGKAARQSTSSKAALDHVPLLRQPAKAAAGGVGLLAHAESTGARPAPPGHALRLDDVRDVNERNAADAKPRGAGRRPSLHVAVHSPASIVYTTVTPTSEAGGVSSMATGLAAAGMASPQYKHTSSMATGMAAAGLASPQDKHVRPVVERGRELREKSTACSALPPPPAGPLGGRPRAAPHRRGSEGQLCRPHVTAPLPRRRRAAANRRPR